MDYPRKVYAILTSDGENHIEGVYVGSAVNINQRIQQHENEYCVRTQEELHDTMRKNGYWLRILDTIEDETERHKEYDWIDFFRVCIGCKVYNTRLGLSLSPYWERVKGQALYMMLKGAREE